MEATRLTTRAGKIAAHVLADRTVLIDTEYFRVERIKVNGRRESSSLVFPSGSKSTAGLSYLFAASGAGRISGREFDALDLPARAIAAIPATTQDFVVEDAGELDLIRISPNWPGKAS